MTENFDNALVRIQQGFIQGYRENNLSIFKGIPFAMPPIGERRWKVPVAPDSWRGIRDATRFGGESIQDGHESLSLTHYSEDCLYLNIWSPAKSKNEKLPVFVWIHGGAFTNGAGSRGMYCGDELAKKGIIVVTINYRLGILGFFTHPELTAESEFNSSGNYAIMDQRQALIWVNQNISAFGGDPDNITVAGQSAGGASVACLIASSFSTGLFKRACIQSAPVFGEFLCPPSLAESEKEGLAFANFVGVLSVKDLRNMSAWELFEHSKKFGYHFVPVVDGWFLPKTPEQAVLANEHNRADIITGGTSEEFSTNISINGINPDDFELHIRKIYGEYAERMLALYPHSTPIEAAQSFSKITADNMYFGSLCLAEKYAEYGQRVFLYYFTRRAKYAYSEIYGAPHSAELPYLFKRVDKGGISPVDHRKWDDADISFAEDMMEYWANFAKCGNPNGVGLPYWPEFKSSSDIMELGNIIGVYDYKKLAQRIDIFQEMSEKGVIVQIDPGAYIE